MWVSIRLFWQGLVGAATLAKDGKFVIVALPQPGATQGLFCLESFHLMHLERLSELSGRYPSDDTFVALSVTHLEGCIPIHRAVAVSCPAKRPSTAGHREVQPPGLLDLPPAVNTKIAISCAKKSISITLDSLICHFQHAEVSEKKHFAGGFVFI